MLVLVGGSGRASAGWWSCWSMELLRLLDERRMVVQELLLNWLKGEGSTRRQVVRLNCWFCCKDVDIQFEQKQSWMCSCCGQYNGFTEDGDYSQPVQEQFDVKDYKTPTVCSPSDFVTTKSVLCENCSQNQLLKVRQLAAFIPFWEASHDEEVDVYNDYLENRYSLCDICTQKVSQYLDLQDQRLAGTMKDEHFHLLGQLKKKTHDVSANGHIEQGRSDRSMLPCLMFMLCMCASIVRVILGSTHSPASALMHESYILSGWLLCGQQTCVYLGVVFCTMGLLIAGKNSLYPNDAVHLMLWLVLIVTTSDLPTSSWLDITRERVLFIDAGTVLLSFICCLRKRPPRHLTVATIYKKQFSQPDTPVGDMRNIDTRSEFADTSTSLLSSDQHFSASSDNTQFEDVQQNLESLSLGLTKRSWSASSIWSLPAIVSTSTVNGIPDSTTENSTKVVRQSHSVLSPSRLGFLSLDSVLRDGRCSLSDNTHISDSNQAHHSSDGRCSLSDKRPISDSNDSHHSSSLVQLKQRQLSSNMTEQSLVSDNVYKSALKVSASLGFPCAVFQDSGPCDSQTPDSLLQLPAPINTRLKSRQNDGKTSANVTSPWSSWPKHNKISMYRGHAVDSMEMAAPMQSEYFGYHSIGPRWSSRTAVTGRPSKPWPLKKSMSCSNIWSQEIQHGMLWRNSGLAGPKHTWRDNTSGTTNSVFNSHLPPVDEAAVNSQTHYAAVGRGTDDRTISRHLLQSGDLCTNAAPGHTVSEFSDDENDGDTLEQPSFLGNYRSPGMQSRSDVPWPWLLVGIVMGASLACNVILVCQGWLAHVD